MRIALPCAAPIAYSPAYYLETAFRKLGHDAQVYTQGEFNALSPDDADLFVGVDSGGPLNIPEVFFPKFVMWFIDSRRNHNPAIRTPDDDTFGWNIVNGGGLAFQAQLPDVERLRNKIGGPTMMRVKWLPLAADPDVWSDTPSEEFSGKPLAFIGNCYDLERLGILNRLSEGDLLEWPGIEGAIMSDGARVYRSALAGLNVPSWLGTSECYDVNMRVFEILSCGIPLVTNMLPALRALGIIEGEHYYPYPTPREKVKDGDTVDVIVGVIRRIVYENLDSVIDTNVGRNARELILRFHTYTHRALTILEHARYDMNIGS